MTGQTGRRPRGCREMPAGLALTPPPLPRPAPWHLVADARLVEDVRGVISDVPQLAPEPADDGGHGPHFGVAFHVPDPLEQVLVGQHSSGVRR